jgi:RNA polymerase sigma-70 factor (ECF subfamily)
MSPELDPARLGDHLDRLFRAAWALAGNREDAEDLVQETYVRVLARPRFLRNDDDLGYLLRVLRNTFLTHLRDRSRRIDPVAMPDDPVVEDLTSPSPQAAVEVREVYAAVASLPDEYRDAVVAVDIVGLSYKEAAKALGTKEGTIMSRLYRGRQRVVRSVEG